MRLLFLSYNNEVAFVYHMQNEVAFVYLIEIEAAFLYLKGIEVVLCIFWTEFAFDILLRLCLLFCIL